MADAPRPFAAGHGSVGRIELLADSIRNVFEERSVSAIFEGENELF